MPSLTIASDAARRRERPVALIIAPASRVTHYQGAALREFDVEIMSADQALALTPAALEACALLLADSEGLDDSSAASLLSYAMTQRQAGIEVILICPQAHVDFLGALIGSGATLLCEPRAGDIDRALQDATQAIARRHSRKGSHPIEATPGPLSEPPCRWPTGAAVAEPARPYWLDILSDQLTDVAIARQAATPESAAIAELFEHMVARLLALIPDRDLLDALATSPPDQAPAEIECLAAELRRRELATPPLNAPQTAGPERKRLAEHAFRHRSGPIRP